MPLEEIFPEVDQNETYSYYRYRLYNRGAVASKEGQATIPPHILEKEARSGFKRSGQYTERLRFFTDGLVVGCKEKVGVALDQFRQQNYYQRRKNPISHLDGLMFTLREQRSNAK